MYFHIVWFRSGCGPDLRLPDAIFSNHTLAVFLLLDISTGGPEGVLDDKPKKMRGTELASRLWRSDSECTKELVKNVRTTLQMIAHIDVGDLNIVNSLISRSKGADIVFPVHQKMFEMITK